MSPPTYPASSRKQLSLKNKIAIAFAVLFTPSLCLLTLGIVFPNPQETVIEVQNHYDFPVQIYSDYYSHTSGETPEFMGTVPAGGKSTRLRYALPSPHYKEYHLIVADAKGTFVGDVFDDHKVIKPQVREPSGILSLPHIVWHVSLPQDVIPRTPSSHEKINNPPE